MHTSYHRLFYRTIYLSTLVSRDLSIYLFVYLSKHLYTYLVITLSILTWRLVKVLLLVAASGRVLGAGTLVNKLGQQFLHAIGSLINCKNEESS